MILEYYISIFVFAFGIITWIPFINGVYGHDVAYNMYVVERSKKGNFVFYKDYFMSPIGHYLHTIFMQSICDKSNTKAFYWIMCLNCSLSAVVLFWVLTHLFGIIPAVSGSMLFSLYIGSPRLDGNWGPFEQLMPLPLFGSLLCIIISSDISSFYLIILGGALFGYAILVKQTAAVTLPGYLIILIGTGHTLYGCLYFLSGIIISNLIPLFYYWLKHNAFWEYLVSFCLLLLPFAINPRKYNKFYPAANVRGVISNFKEKRDIIIKNSRSLPPLLFLSLIGATILFVNSFSLIYLGLFVCLILSVSTIFMRGTFFAHYWLNIIPWLAIFAGYGLSEIIKSSFRAGHLTVFTLIGILTVILLFIDAIRVDKKYYVFSKDPYHFLRKVYGQAVVNGYKLWTQIGEYIKETTKPDDKILICGHAPHILLFSDRAHITAEACLYTEDYLDIYNRENPTHQDFLNQIYKFKNFKLIKQKENVFKKGHPKLIVFTEGIVDIEGFEKLTGVKYSFEAKMGGIIPVFRADLELTELMSLYENPDNAKSSIESDSDLERDKLADNTDPTEPVQTDNTDWDTALKKAKQLLRTDPYNIEYLLVLGDCLIGSDKYKLLFSFYNRLCEKKIVPSSSVLHLLNKLGEAYCNQNKFNDAEELFHKILNLNSNNPTVLNNLGFIYSQQNNNHKASEYFQKSLELDPDNMDAIYNLDQIKTQCN